MNPHLARLLTLLAILFSGFEAAAQKPVVSTVVPLAAPVGTTVIVNGSNFSPVAANNTVRFGAVKAVIKAASSTSLTVLIPPGATYDPVSVTVNGLTAYAKDPFLLSFAGGGSGFYTNSFSSRIDSTTGSGTTNVAISDMDGDGKPDLAFCNAVSNHVSFFKNTANIGSFAFAPKIDLTTGTAPTDLRFVDLDGDGMQDLIVCNSRSNTLSVLHNASIPGNISYTPTPDLVTGNTPLALSVGDLDGDGRPDIAVVNSVDNTVSVFMNHSQPGSLAFDPKMDFATGSSPSAITATDLNADGKLDLAIANAVGNSVSVLVNTTTGNTPSFATKMDYPTGQRPFSMISADFDGDGKTDLAVGSSSSSIVTILKNNTASGVPAFLRTDLSVQFTALGTAVADLDADGKPDLVVGNSGADWISVIRNQSTTSGISFAQPALYTMGSSPYGVAIADLDADGRPDIITANDYSGWSILRNTVPSPAISSFTPSTAGTGTVVSIKGVNFTGATGVRFGGVPASSFSVDSAAGITAVVDTGLSGDVTVTTPYGIAAATGFQFSKIPTILAFSPTAGSAKTLVTITGTNLTGTTSVYFGSTPADSFKVVSATVITAWVGPVPAGNLTVSVTNASGTASLGGFYTGPVVRSFNPASGPVGTTVTISGANFSTTASDNIVYFGAVPATVLTADSGSLKVLVPSGATYRPITVTCHQLTAYSVHPFLVTFKSDGSAFTPASFLEQADSTAGTFSVHTAIGDLNGDGKADLVVTNPGDNTISVIKNTSSGGAVSFARKVDYPAGYSPEASGIADLDGDGRPDVVTVTRYDYTFTDTFYVYRNNSTGSDITFAPAIKFPAGYEFEASGIVINDFDGDGRPDLAVSNFNGGSVTVYRNTGLPGTISFDAGSPFFVGYLPSDVYAADVNGDGKPDLVVPSQNFDAIYVLINTSLAGKVSFAAGIRLDAGFSSTNVFLGDLDGDGLPEIVVTNRGNVNLSVYPNTSSGGAASFGTRINYNLSNIPYNVTIGDLDGDGKPDLAVTTSSSNTISVLKNRSTKGNFVFDNYVSYPGRYGYDHRFVSIADVNGDGRPDLVVTESSGAGNEAIFVNKIPGDGLPDIVIHVSGATEVCAGDSTILSVDGITGATYQWYKDGVALTNATDSGYKAMVSGSYSVTRTFSGTTASAAPVDITVKMLPPTPDLTTTDALLCRGLDAKLTSSLPVGNQWYKDGTALPGVTGQTYMTGDSGTYSITAAINGCISQPSAGKIIAMAATPAASVTAMGPRTFCAGDSLLLQANAANGLSYQWYVGGTPIPGATGVAIAATYSGNYAVETSNAACSATSPAISLVVSQPPIKPQITQSGKNLISSATAGNQWYRNGVALSGDTSQAYAPSATGSYTVTTSPYGCASPASDPYTFTDTIAVTGPGSGRGTGTNTNPTDSSTTIKFGPNPVRNQLWVSFNFPQVTAVNMQIYDLKGASPRAWKAVHSGTLLDLAGLGPGYYCIRIFDDNGKVDRIIKILKE